MAEEHLVKLYVELPNHFGTGGESVWAAPLGGDRYEVRNIPFRAYGLNYLDVVEARAIRAGSRPTVLRVLQSGGHRTLRVRFLNESTSDFERVDLLRAFERLGASFEAATRAYIAIDLPPECLHDQVIAELERLQLDGVLEYESCEPRVPGSFDIEPGFAPRPADGGEGERGDRHDADDADDR